jgi:hypothetical protein
VTVLYTGLPAAAPPCELTIARLQYDGGGDWYADPSSLPNLVAHVRGTTELPVCDTVATITPLSQRLYQYPFLYMTGHGNVRFSEQEVIALRRYFSNGGFLWADDNYGMDDSFRREMRKIFPNASLVPLQADHGLFSAHFDLPGVPKIHEHDGNAAQAYAVYLDERIVVLYTFSADIGDGMENTDVHDVSDRLHTLALRMGTNIVTYFFEH